MKTENNLWINSAFSVTNLENPLIFKQGLTYEKMQPHSVASLRRPHTIYNHKVTRVTIKISINFYSTEATIFKHQITCDYYVFHCKVTKPMFSRFLKILVCEAIDTAATPGLLCQPRMIVKMIVEK
jgi:hypothetical protein